MADARIRFDGEGHKRPAEDHDGRVQMRQQTIWIDGCKVTARNDDGWVTIAVELTDAVIGYAVEVNGRTLPITVSPERSGDG